MNRYKVLLIMPELFYGGAETQFRKLITNIDREKFSLTVLVEHSNGGMNDEKVNLFLEQNKDVVFRFMSGLTTDGNVLNRYISYAMANLYIRKYIKEIEPDLVFVYSRIGLKLVKTLRLLGVPTIYSERNVWNNPSVFWKQNGSFLRQCSKISCNSIDAKSLIESHNLTVTYIPNGIEEKNILVEDHTSNKYNIVVPARIAPVKNQKTIIESLRYVKHSNIHIRFIGVVEDTAYYEQLVSICKDINLESRVSFEGFCSDPMMIYQNADLIVLASFFEGLSNVILESYMYGRMLLASNITQNTAVGSENQLYFDPNNPIDIANKIDEIYEMSIQDKNQCIQSNRVYAINNFSVNKMVQSYEKIIIETINTVRD